MSHFEKFEKICLTSGVKFFKHGIIFEVGAKSSSQKLWNCISEILTWGFVSNFKNKAVFEKFNTALFLWHVLFSQSGSSSHNFFKYIYKVNNRFL